MDNQHCKIEGYREPSQEEIDLMVDLMNEIKSLLLREVEALFTDSTNANMSFQDSLAAILLSGIQCGQALKMRQEMEPQESMPEGEEDQ